MDMAPLGDYKITFTDGQVTKPNGSFEIIEGGVLHFVDTHDGPKHSWYSPSHWLSIEKRT
jgi:hypothetical protein